METGDDKEQVCGGADYLRDPAGRGGKPATSMCRELGISEQTFYTCRKKFAGMGVAELRRLRQLEEENGRLKQLVADLALDCTDGITDSFDNRT